MILKKIEILEGLKKTIYNDIEDLVYRLQLTYDKFIDHLDLKDIPTKRKGYSLNRRIYEVVDLKNTLNCILPDSVKIMVTINDVRLKSRLKINQTLIFTKKSL